MILIADSGSTKCNWAACSNNGEIIQIHKTVGFNPKYTSDKNLLDALEESALNLIKEKITSIHFYGSGCSSPARNRILANPMQKFFPHANIYIKHDLDAAVKATYTNRPIICSILWTGSNSCFYDEKNIIENAPSLGYIAGDEASGNYFGKQYFFNLHIKCFDNHKKYPLTFVGSVAFYLQDYIYEIAEKEEIQVQKIVQSPIENLVKEHFSQ